MGKINKLRYNGFSILARALWTLENLEGEAISFPKLIVNIDSVDIWTDELAPHMKEWFKEMAKDYMLTSRFKKEQERHRNRQLQKQRDGYFNSDNAENPYKWFNAEVLSPSGWVFANGIAILYRKRMQQLKAKTTVTNSTQTAPPKETEEKEEEKGSDSSSADTEYDDNYSVDSYYGWNRK
jgi:hypothetical protein